MKKALIQVPSMRSEHCQLRVKEGITKLGKVQHLEIKSGIVEIDFQDQTQLESVQQAIVDLGYTVIAAHVQEDSTSPEQTYQFKTNINCSGCVARVQPFLAEASGVCHWGVDIDNPGKILTVHSDGISQQEIISTVEKAGFKIEPLK